MMLYIIPYLFYSCLAAIGIMLQADLFSYLQILNCKPDLLLIIAVLAGVKTGRDNGAVVGAVVGFWADLLIGGYFGIHILVYAIVGYLFGLLGRRINLRNYAGYFFAVLLGSIFSGTLFLASFSLVGENLSFWQNFGGIILPMTFYDCLLVLLSFPIIFIYRKFRGLKIGYVDMFGGGIVLITNNEKVDFNYVEQRKGEKRSNRNKRSKNKGKEALGNGDKKYASKNDNRKAFGRGNRKRKTANKKARPTFPENGRNRVKKKK